MLTEIEVVGSMKAHHRPDKPMDRYVLTEVLKRKPYLKQYQPESGDRWLDVGGNIGTFVMSVLENAPDVSVVSVEPEPGNFEVLELNVLENSLSDRVTALNAAVVGKVTSPTVPLYLGSSPGSYSLITKRGRDVMEVPVLSINDLLRDHSVNCLKLDCEGAEFEIIQEITEDSWSRLRYLTCEFHFNILKDKPLNGFPKWTETRRLIASIFPFVDMVEDPQKNWHTVFVASRSPLPLRTKRTRSQ